PLGFGKRDLAAIGLDACDAARCIFLPIAGLRGIDPLTMGWRAADPVQVRRPQRVSQERGVIVPLYENKAIVLEVFRGDVPWLAAPFAPPADAQTLTLSDRKESQSFVVPHQRALGRADFARFVGEIALEEIAERPLANKTETRGI